MTRWYGSINNRIDEGHYYNGTYQNIKVGDFATEYLWSDRHAYEVVEVKDQKHVKIRRLDAKMITPYSNEWTYTQNESNPVKELELQKKGWKSVKYVDLESWNNALIEARKDITNPDENPEKVRWLAQCYLRLNDENLEKVLSGKRVKTVSEKISVSFGIADEYYDYSF